MGTVGSGMAWVTDRVCSCLVYMLASLSYSCLLVCSPWPSGTLFIASASALCTKEQRIPVGIRLIRGIDCYGSVGLKDFSASAGRIHGGVAWFDGVLGLNDLVHPCARNSAF
jgi:hypothetical protein